MSDSRKIRNMEEFASVSGLSRPTVSKYFNDPTSVRETTRKRIEAALEEFDFRPNIYAINQNRRLTKTIGIVVPYLADPFFAEIARTIETRLIEAGYAPSLFSSHGRPELENDILDSLRSMKPAGVLLAALGRTSDKSVIERFCKDVPTVLFDSNLGEVGRAFVGSDNPQFMAEMVRYLSRSGDAPCYLEMKTPPNPNTRRRRAGYLTAMEANGAEPEIFEVEGEGWNLEEIGYQGGLKVLRSGVPRTKTILCTNDRLAIGLLAACYERGLKVGIGDSCDIRIAGLDDHPFARYTSPPLTTVAHDYDAIAERTVTTLFDIMDSDGHGEGRTETLFPGRLVMRASA